MIKRSLILLALLVLQGCTGFAMYHKANPSIKYTTSSETTVSDIYVLANQLVINTSENTAYVFNTADQAFWQCIHQNKIEPMISDIYITNSQHKTQLSVQTPYLVTFSICGKRAYKPENTTNILQLDIQLEHGKPKHIRVETPNNSLHILKNSSQKIKLNKINRIKTASSYTKAAGMTTLGLGVDSYILSSPINPILKLLAFYQINCTLGGGSGSNSIC